MSLTLTKFGHKKRNRPKLPHYRNLCSRHPASHLPPAEKCRVIGCYGDTSERKPYCILHLNNLPYVQEIQSNLSNSTEEIKKANQLNGWKYINLDSIISQDILRYLLNQGPENYLKIAVDFKLNREEIQSYLKALKIAKLICIIKFKVPKHGFNYKVSITFLGKQQIKY